MAKGPKTTTAAELEGKLFAFVVIQHPNEAIGEIVFKVRRGIPATLLMSGEAAMPNPVLAAVEEPKKKAKADEVPGLSYLQAIAKGSLIEPTYSEVEPFIENDIFILAAIAKEATGMQIFGKAFAGDLFRQGQEEKGNAAE